MSDIEKEIAAIVDEMSLPISNNGYQVKGEHFEIGNKIHTTSYYYAKRYFQKLDNALTIANLLVKKFDEIGLSLEDTTLIGYGSYSRLFLSEICKASKSNGNDGLNYALLDIYQNEYTFLFEPEIKENVVILLSITCTFASFHSIRAFIRDKYSTANVNFTFISVFLIKDTRLKDGKIDNPDNDPEVQELYSSFNWVSIDSKRKLINLEKENDAAQCYYLIELTSTIYLSGECNHCYPELNNKTVGEELPLFPTHTNHDTPSYIFGNPKFSSSDDLENRRPFNSLINLERKLNPVLYGYLQADNGKFINYLKTDIFYKKNSDKILQYFSQKLIELFRNKEFDTNKTSPPLKDDLVVFITPIHLKSSTFLEDIVHQQPLIGKTVLILPYQPSTEFVENFVYLYGTVLTEASCILYFDDFISSGNTFKLLSDYLKHAKGSKGSAIDPDDVEGFDGLLTFVDSTTIFSKNEILRKLVYHPESRPAKEKFLAFFRLNLNQIDTLHFGNPIEERENLLVQILGDCHLDALKSIVLNEIKKAKITTLHKAENSYSSATLKYFPFAKNKDLIGQYIENYTYQRLNLIKIMVFHDLAENFSAMSPDEEPKKCYDFLKRLIKKLTKSEKLDEYFNMAPNAQRDLVREANIIKDIIIKTLCRSPFKYYTSIFQATFKYNLNSLIKINGNLNSRPIATEQSRSGSFEDFRRLKFHIRRSVELNSNFIISVFFLKNVKLNFKKDEFFVIQYNRKIEFLTHELKNLSDSLTKESIQNIYIRFNNLKYKKQQVKSYRYFLLNCYKELIVKNPSRSFRLERLLNLKDLVPEVILNINQTQFAQLISDPYYQLSRILRIENIYHLNKFKEYQLKKVDINNIDSILAEPIDRLKEKYFVTEIGELPNKHARNLLKCSTSEIDAFGLPSETDALIVMLKISMLLKQHALGKQHNKKHHQNKEVGFKYEINRILRMVCDIMEKRVDTQELDYCLFMKYRDREGPTDTDHIFTILSDDQEDLDDGKMIQMDTNGLILNMLDGLLDTEDGNVQTFIALAKNGDEILSFQDEYRRSVPESNMQKDSQSIIAPAIFKETLYGPENESDILPLNVQVAYKKDCVNGKTGLKMFSEANMVLLFRLATIETQEGAGALTGEAVIAICSKAPVNPENFIDFIKVEKIRLLLLIKEQLIEYFRKEFRSAAFAEVLQSRKNIQMKRSIQHGLREYFEAFNDITGQIERMKSSGNQLDKLEQNFKMLRFISKTIQCHFLSMNDIDFGDTYKQLPEKRSSTQLRDMFETIRTVPYLANNEIPLTDMKIDIPLFEFYCHDVVMDLVIPELMVNMRKYALRFPGKKYMGIKINGKILEFTNSFDPNYHGESDIKKFGGIDMCNNILEKYLNLRPMVGYFHDNKFTMPLPLPTQ